MKKEFIKKGQELIKSNNLKVVYITSDGQCFDKLSNASNNARGLEDNEIIIVNADNVQDVDINESKTKKSKE